MPSPRAWRRSAGRSDGFLNENPSRWDSLRVDHRLYDAPGRSSMRLVSIPTFQLLRPNPHSRGGPVRSASMVRSCTRLRRHGLPGLLPSCLPSGYLRSILASHPWMVPIPRPIMPAIFSSSSSCFLNTAACNLSLDLPGGSRLCVSLSSTSDTMRRYSFHSLPILSLAESEEGRTI